MTQAAEVWTMVRFARLDVTLALLTVC